MPERVLLQYDEAMLRKMKDILPANWLYFQTKYSMITANHQQAHIHLAA